MCYTYDELSRVTKRTIKNLCDDVLSEESYSYDAAGNITDAPDSCFGYDTNNRLVVFNGNSVSYDMDGNMLSNGSLSCTYDSANRLITAGGHAYTYNAEDIRIRNLCDDYDTTYTYNTNCKLSQLLVKTTNNVTTKYVYGHGLIGEDQCGAFKTYHFDFRGSTVAITDIDGNITDTFKYDTYGKLISRTGTSFVIFGYNGRDGVVTDKNGLIYMRARYYSPDMRRFVNADIVAGEISNAVTLNRFAYANGNPVSLVDPFGLEAERGNFGSVTYKNEIYQIFVPNHITGNTLDDWELLGTFVSEKFQFDGIRFITGLISGADDFDGMANGSNPMTEHLSNRQLVWCSAFGLASGVADSFSNSSNEIRLEYSFYKKGNQRKVIIKAGSSNIQSMYNKYADGKTHYLNDSSQTQGDFVYVSEAVSSHYESIFSESLPWGFFTLYDIGVTIDKSHKDNPYASYIWIDKEGNIMESPITYPNDKVEFIKSTWVLIPVNKTPIREIPLSTGSYPVAEEYQKIFSNVIE